MYNFSFELFISIMQSLKQLINSNFDTGLNFEYMWNIKIFWYEEIKSMGFIQKRKFEKSEI